MLSRKIHLHLVKLRIVNNMRYDIGFISTDMVSATSNYNVNIVQTQWVWDRQTVVLLCDNQDMIDHVRSSIHHNRRPNSIHQNVGYSIDGFVNLNYNRGEKDPANRNVRIVYCNLEHIKIEEIYKRFECSYIIKVERSGYNGTSRISREVSKIPG